jgi:LytS/YehU family sensor histidine kinase
MNNLHGLILTDTRLASETVLRLSDFLQYMVYDSSALTIPLEKELQMVGDYLALERLRADEKKIIEFDTDIRDPNYHIAPLVLLPLVENGIKHGLNVVEEGAFLRVRIRQELDLLQVEVVNAKAVTSYGEGGIGLQNLRHRLQLQYPGQYSLVTANEDTFFRTTLTVTLHAA